MPSVSVIIPAFNAAAHVGHALASVFAQTFTDYEVILINDGSSDTQQLEKLIQPNLSRIIYLKQKNGGPSAARNLGIRQARGEWLAFLDSDDVWLPNYLEEQVRFLRSHPEFDMVYCDATLAGGAAAGKTYMQVCPSSGPVTFESLLLEHTQPITSGTVARRQNATAAGLFDEAIRCSEDHDLWMRIAHAGGKIGYQRTVLLRRTVRPDSQGSAPGGLLAGEIQTLIKLNRELDLSPVTRELLAHRLALHSSCPRVSRGQGVPVGGGARPSPRVIEPGLCFCADLQTACDADLSSNRAGFDGSRRPPLAQAAVGVSRHGRPFHRIRSCTIKGQKRGGLCCERLERDSG